MNITLVVTADSCTQLQARLHGTGGSTPVTTYVSESRYWDVTEVSASPADRTGEYGVRDQTRPSPAHPPWEARGGRAASACAGYLQATSAGQPSLARAAQFL
jgi:hypothetical protein